MEGKRYCILCGSLLETDAAVCPSCGRKIPEKDSPLREYLLRNTKEKLKEKAEDTVFSAVKNWILSHLYGVVVSVLIVGIIAVNLAQPSLPQYIEYMDSPYGESHEVQEPELQSPEYHGPSASREDLQAVTDTVQEFEHAVFYELVMSEAGDAGGVEVPEQASADYLLPSSYGVAVRNDFYYVFGYKVTYSDVDYAGIVIDDPKTDTGKELLAAGYSVAEVSATNIYKDDRSEGAPAVRSDPFIIILVKADGKWYIAETRALG